MRRAALALLACFGAAVTAAAQSAPRVVGAEYAEPTRRYDHAVVGDAEEWAALRLSLADGRVMTLRLPETRVFEDVAPRLADLDGDGGAEVIVVETSLTNGARLSVYDAEGLVAATPFIGRPHRWLAPVGAADLDADGHAEIAYVDRPHLAGTLRIWRFAEGALTEVASRSGFSNHRIGEDFIQGGISTCGGVPTILTADAEWRRVLATTFRDGRLASRDIGPYSGRTSLQPDRAC